MRTALHRIIIMAAVMSATVSVLSARQYAIGGLFSLNGSGIVFRQELRSRIFYEVGLEIDYSYHVFVSQSSPGVWAKYGYNVVFVQKEGTDGLLRCYGGTGVAIGYTNDPFNSQKGLAGGLTGTIGIEYVFKVPVILSFSITPCLGFQLDNSTGTKQLDFYYGGMTYGFLPGIGIKYRF